MKQTIEITVDIPEGYEFDRFDCPHFGDEYLNGCGALRTWEGIGRCMARYVILRKKPKRYRVFEETGEVRFPEAGEWVILNGNICPIQKYCHAELSILREVTDQVTVTEQESSDE